MLLRQLQKKKKCPELLFIYLQWAYICNGITNMPSHKLRKGAYCKALRVNATGRHLDQNYLSPCIAMWIYCSVCLCMYRCVQETEQKAGMRACPLSCLLPLVAFKNSRRAFSLMSHWVASHMALEIDQILGINAPKEGWSLVFVVRTMFVFSGAAWSTRRTWTGFELGCLQINLSL